MLFCLIAAKHMEKDLLKSRKRFYPPTNIGVRQQVKPIEIIGTVLLGGLRVFIVDALWMKVIDHQESGDFHEVVLTAELIADLQPTYVNVWEYLNWLMSVQIPSEEKNIQTQIQWIKVGLSYIQKGIIRNPDSAKLYLAYARTVYERMGLHHERNIERYYILRRNGEDPLPMAREFVLKAIKANTYTVFSERQLFIVNQYRVKESFFHFRRTFEKKFNYLKYLFEKFLNDEAHTQEKLNQIRGKYIKYKKEFGRESSFKAIQKNIALDLQDIRDCIGRYPEQFDFELTLETHENTWKEDLFLIRDFLNLDGYLEEMVRKRVGKKLKKSENEICLLYIEKAMLEFQIWDIRNNSDLNVLYKEMQKKYNELSLKIIKKKKEMKDE